MSSPNQTPEQIARDRIDARLREAGWIIQTKGKMHVGAGLGIAVTELHTTAGPADYVLFIDGEAVGVIEAKRDEEGVRLTQHEDQTEKYRTSPIKLLENDKPLRFAYESTGELTRFTDTRDPAPRSRPVFNFHKPETLYHWIKQGRTLRARLHDIPALDPEGLRDCQINAITELEKSFRDARPRALIQMATGAGKTFTAITSIYRLLKHANAKRVLFLVDTKNLGEQAEQEFMAFQPLDDNRKFTDLYKVQRLASPTITTDSKVCISTIQRMYSILQGEELPEEEERENPAEKSQPKEPMAVEYNPAVPPEFFDFVVIDECHRSIYNLWKQVLEYFDAFQIGLTATPDKRTFAYFKKNVVSEYPYEQSVIDGVNVGFDIYRLETEVTQNGATIASGDFVEIREKLTRKQKWEQVDDEIQYDANRLDKDVVNKSQIRTIIRGFKDRLPVLFHGRDEADGTHEVPKTLIFAKDDSHADDIVQIVREEFGQGNAFCKKVTYKAEDDPKTTLANLRNDYNPRIAVTVDMIATGTDVKPLECLIFMRDVRSRNYFEQMKGRGCRSLKPDDLLKVTPKATLGKSGFIIVDAVGVTTSIKSDSRPLERKRGQSLKQLLDALGVGKLDEDTFVSLAGRLLRLQKQLPEEKLEAFERLAGAPLGMLASGLIKAHDADTIDEAARVEHQVAEDEEPTKAQKAETAKRLAKEAARPFSPDVRDFIENARKALEQYVDTQNPDSVALAEWDTESVANAERAILEFREYLEAHKDEITALQIFYDLPFKMRPFTYDMIRELLERLKADKPALAPARVWHAFEQVEESTPAPPKGELVALVSLLRRVVGLDETLTDYADLVRKRFQEWVFKRHSGTPEKFTEEQLEWLRMIRDHVATSFHISRDDLDLTPFDARGGLTKFYQLFGQDFEAILAELNERLVA